jgi:hypothetical protein
LESRLHKTKEEEKRIGGNKNRSCIHTNKFPHHFHGPYTNKIRIHIYMCFDVGIHVFNRDFVQICVMCPRQTYAYIVHIFLLGACVWVSVRNTYVSVCVCVHTLDDLFCGIFVCLSQCLTVCLLPPGMSSPPPFVQKKNIPRPSQNDCPWRLLITRCVVPDRFHGYPPPANQLQRTTTSVSDTFSITQLEMTCREILEIK